MSKFLDKTQVQTPVKRFRDFDLSCQQLTTSFFMRPTVAYAVELPKHKLKCNLKSYARLQPLLKPVLGSVQVHNRAFYVPFRTVWPCWDSFITSSPYATPTGTMVINAVPTISHDVIARCFVDDVNGLSVDVLSFDPGERPVPDFYYKTGSGVVGAVFTPLGRHAMKVLNQLGYRVSFGVASYDNGTSQPPTNVGGWPKDAFSFLPLLCYAKLFLDWMYPAQYAHSGDAASVEGMFNRGFRYDADVDDFMRIINFTAWAYYGNDYFTSSFDTPVAPAVGTYEQGLVIPDVTQTFPVPYNSWGGSEYELYGTQIEFGPGGTPRVASQVRSNDAGASVGDDYSQPGSWYYFTQYLDDSLKAMTNWQRRHQLVGARVLDRYLADFGVIPTWEQLKRSQFIGSQTFPIQFQDVMSNSDTVDSASNTGAQLGAYAGKGVAYDGQGNFEFSSDEFGFFIIVNTIVPDIAYYQGLNRHVLHRKMTDFLNGEFESLGTQPVSAAELVFDYNSGSGNIPEIFGFLPRYSEYKCGKDLVTGLFNYNSVNQGLLAWSTVRTVAASDRHGIGFLRGDDAWQFARIFYGDVTGPESEMDKFFFVHRINIKVSMQASPMYDVYDFDEPEGDKIMMQVNGAQL